MKLKNRVAIITGAGRNIGEATARLFAAEGAKVVVVDLSDERASYVASEIIKEGGQAIAVVADVASEIEVDEVVKAAVSAFGQVDILPRFTYEVQRG
jgi:3-oxoacyl-[acyl-carrier protein] reductase